MTYKTFTSEALEARRLVALRDRWLNPPEWVEWVDEPVPSYPNRPVPRDEDAAKVLKQRMFGVKYFCRRVASFEDVTRLPQNDRTDGLPAGSGELPDVEIILSPCRPGIGGRVRGAAIKAVSPAERGRSAATRLDGGEHRCRLSAIRQGRRRALTWRSRSPLLG